MKKESEIIKKQNMSYWSQQKMRLNALGKQKQENDWFSI